MLGSTKRLSRREFLKTAGVVTGGAVLGLLVACRDNNVASTTGTITPPTNTGLASVPTASITISAPTIGTTTSPVSTPATTAATNSTIPTAPIGDVYVPPSDPPPLMDVFGCTAKVASDRWYNVDHAWVKEMGGGKVVIGVSDKMQELLGTVNRFSFTLKEGGILSKEDVFAWAEAVKLNVDFCAPVSGKILQLNNQVYIAPGTINMFPYSYGWMAVVQLSDPGEIDGLFGPNYYAYLQAQGLPSTVSPPPQHS